MPIFLKNTAVCVILVFAFFMPNRVFAQFLQELKTDKEEYTPEEQVMIIYTVWNGSESDVFVPFPVKWECVVYPYPLVYRKEISKQRLDGPYEFTSFTTATMALLRPDEKITVTMKLGSIASLSKEPKERLSRYVVSIKGIGCLARHTILPKNEMSVKALPREEVVVSGNDRFQPIECLPCSASRLRRWPYFKRVS